MHREELEPRHRWDKCFPLITIRKSQRPKFRHRTLEDLLDFVRPWVHWHHADIETPYPLPSTLGKSNHIPRMIRQLLQGKISQLSYDVYGFG